MAISWKVRVAGALVLASLFKMSDGSAFWTSTLPDILGAGAVATVIAMLVLSRRRGHIA
jgi:predicted membrane protein